MSQADAGQVSQPRVPVTTSTSLMSRLVRARAELSRHWLPALFGSYGIEDGRQAEELRKLGCHFGQGVFYGAPMTSKELEAYARRRRAMSAA